MDKIGPVQVLAVGFPPAAPLEGQNLAELARLESSGTIRVLDLLAVQKDESGDLLALELKGAEELGGTVGALLGFEFEGAETSVPQDDVAAIADGLEPGATAAIALIEHLWARDFADGIRAAGGRVLLEGFLSKEALAEVAPELDALVEELEAEVTA